MSRKIKPEQTPQAKTTKDKNHAPKTSWRLAILIALASVALFFALLEGGLALLDVQPAFQREDPFVGFAGNAPLFGQTQDRMVTAANKKDFFNRQSFAAEKAPGTYRIFSLGGSTTYGRPYDDKTSFSGWLRGLLPLADRSRQWEVINAGGISYASYRVAHLMEELIRYQPDLFIIYTGHNEFLEERTYGQIRELPAIVKSTASLLAKTRTWSAMNSALQTMGVNPGAAQGDRTRLAAEVDAILENSAGLDRYTRDDKLRENILRHFQTSLERMVDLASSVGAQVIFVTPAANLKDCSPFKSEHSGSLAPATRQRAEKLLRRAREEIVQDNWQQALDLLNTLVALDPRHAGGHYLRGQTLLALDRLEEAEEALRRARDEDVCPLRALSPMPRIVREVARENNVPLVDYVELVARRMQESQGHPIPGEEFFLDHVHPTIDGHKLLAIALIDKMIEQGIMHPDEIWGEESIAQVDVQIKASIDNEAHALALANLARVLFWAQKTDEAERLAQRALEKADGYANVAINATSTLATVYMQQGQPEKAIELLYASLSKFPTAMELRLQLGKFMLSSAFREPEKAAANLFLVVQAKPDYDRGHELLGIAMAMHGQMEIASASLRTALRLNPNNSRARQTLEKIRPLLSEKSTNSPQRSLELETYPSKAPRQLVYMSHDQNGSPMVDGVKIEFYQNGRIKRFLDMSEGQIIKEMGWDQNGRIM